jgi:DNA polymerase-2
MNSFYGVLGTKACRYGCTELAGAITSFARKWLFFSKKWFSEKGFRVLYGDTDSLFVESGLQDLAKYHDFLTLGNHLAAEFNAFLTEQIWEEYHLQSFMELRFEKAYRCFMIPPLRSFTEGETRGRAKGYGGYRLFARGDASDHIAVEVKGMEAVRSDSSPLARRLQLELLELVFSGCGERVFTEKVRETIRLVRKGALDTELVYRKRLSKAPETYTASTPPQVKAARALGWKSQRGTVEYVWTINGPAPIALPHAPFDYDHYVDSQILPLARSIAGAANWNAEHFTPHLFEDGQMELSFNQNEHFFSLSANRT